MREWTSTEGNTLEAEFLGSAADSVTIRRIDGRRFTFSLERLSAADREWVAEKRTHQNRPPRKYTKIWGKDGELWDPDDDTLLDFSYAGYHEGRNDIHDVLFTEIDAGEGTLIWDNNFHGACTGTVLWNIKGNRLSLPEEKPWLKHAVLVEDLETLLVGWPIDVPDRREKGRPWFENIAPEEIEPRNIYHAQRRKRLVGATQP